MMPQAESPNSMQNHSLQRYPEFVETKRKCWNWLENILNPDIGPSVDVFPLCITDIMGIAHCSGGNMRKPVLVPKGPMLHGGILGGS